MGSARRGSNPLAVGVGHLVARCAVLNSATGTRTRVARVRAEYPNQLDYSGFIFDAVVGARLRFLVAFGVAGRSSATGTRTRVARVRAEYPNQLDYSGICMLNISPIRSKNEVSMKK